MVPDLSGAFSRDCIDHGTRSPAAHYRREPFEEIIDRLAGFDMVEQGLHRNSRPVKHGGAAHDVRAA